MDLFEAFSTATTFSGLSCPRCNSLNYRKHGHCLGIQRYRCKQCGRCFKETINTPLHCIHNKQKMLHYIHALKKQHTIRRAAADIGISVNTSFCWRHKLLSSLQTSGTQSIPAPAGACQINLPHSFKGKRHIPDKPQPVTRTFLVTDAQGIPCLQLLPPACTALEASKTLRAAITQTSIIAVAPAKLLTRALRFAECLHIRHKASRKKIIGKVHRTATELNTWMYRFRGVATKYLQQYWNWFRVQTNAFSEEQFTVSCISRRQLMNYRQLILT